MFYRTDFEIGLVVREELLPVDQTLKFFIVETSDVVRQMGLEATRGVGSCGVSSSEYIIRTPRSVSEAICGHVVDVSINGDVQWFVGI